MLLTFEDKLDVITEWQKTMGSDAQCRGACAVCAHNDSVELHRLLPPSHDELRDAMCVIFSGHVQKPSRETVKQMRPVMVTKSIVKILIDFLIENNAWYQQCRVAYSEANMNDLFEPCEGNDCSPFLSDANFAFICWNMMQKKEVKKWAHSVHAKPSSAEEKKAAVILHRLHACTKSLKGSAGYKLCRRNEIHSLMKRFSTPALFVTINPHDLTSSMIPVVYWHGPGVFGNCEVFYGMVKAQGRGTLHCHFLIWIAGNPSPEDL
ncbi:hypothetical protein EV702DRAFT_1177653 [Suillus placidus]|uniref:Helitron helicase-like domain-containing protein n=1 Tax=Suillus placidus TaxID=48579 RepID=A0A9P7D5C7_9AGAM|nr:hypothetical protein EV702DRAFT_1177653 [Suillus placidus]